MDNLSQDQKNQLEISQVSSIDGYKHGACKLIHEVIAYLQTYSRGDCHNRTRKVDIPERHCFCRIEPSATTVCTKVGFLEKWNV